MGQTRTCRATLACDSLRGISEHHIASTRAIRCLPWDGRCTASSVPGRALCCIACTNIHPNTSTQEGEQILCSCMPHMLQSFKTLLTPCPPAASRYCGSCC